MADDDTTTENETSATDESTTETTTESSNRDDRVDGILERLGAVESSLETIATSVVTEQDTSPAGNTPWTHRRLF